MKIRFQMLPPNNGQSACITWKTEFLETHLGGWVDVPEQVGVPTISDLRAAMPALLDNIEETLSKHAPAHNKMGLAYSR